MKILFVHPYFLFDRKYEDNVMAMPMGVHYLGAACMEEGHDVRCVNWSAPQTSSAEIISTVKEYQPHVIGFSVFHGNRWGALDIAQCVRELLPRATIVFGGVGATFLPEFFLKNYKCVDIVVKGEADLSFPLLLRTLHGGGPLHSVPGIAFRWQGEVVETEAPQQVTDLDELPMPAERFTFQHLALTRGCPGKCMFCGSPKFWGPKVRSHSPEYFVEQMRLLYKRGVNFFYVSDDTFTLRSDAVLRICELIRSKNLKVEWAAISRVDRVDSRVLTAMRKAGCIQISYGVESGSPQIRKIMRKNVSNEQVERAFRLTTEHGILARAYIIYGSPGETDQTIEESVQLLRRIKPCVCLFHVMSVFPGTELYARCLQEARITEEYWLERNEDLLWFECDPDMSGEQVLAWGKRLKNDYFQQLPRNMEALSLGDKPELRAEQADFLSRLGFTFEYGDYAVLLPEKAQSDLAVSLYRKALMLHVDPRASTGLGIHLQRAGREQEALEMLLRAHAANPQDEGVGLQLAGILIRKGNVESLLEAEAILGKLKYSRQVAKYLAQCRSLLLAAKGKEPQ
jgi:anaerobic magnesium-protoporphyrin IX monomethyl ester cyclase